LAEQQQALTPAAADLLRYAVSVANRAVHGEVVTQEEAHDAFEAAVQGIASLESPHS
jgi:hypothetical protein